MDAIAVAEVTVFWEYLAANSACLVEKCRLNDAAHCRDLLLIEVLTMIRATPIRPTLFFPALVLLGASLTCGEVRAQLNGPLPKFDRFEKHPGRPQPSRPGRDEDTSPTPAPQSEAERIFELGKAAHRANRWAEAEAYYRQRLAISPDRECYTELGRVLIKLARYDEAEAAFLKALELPRNKDDYSRQDDAQRGLDWVRNNRPDTFRPKDPALARRQVLHNLEVERQQSAATASARARIDQLARKLGPDFDARSAETPAGGGLDFAGVPGVSSGTVGRPAVPLGFVDANAVDLRDARTLVVDPARVRGETSNSASAKAEAAAGPQGAPQRITDYHGLENFSQQHGFHVTSTTGGSHNLGSLHYQGRAIDVRVWDKTKEQVDQFITAAKAAGIHVLDERTRPPNQAVWSGPHVHLDIPPDNPSAR